MLKWILFELFNSNKTEQEKIDWNWFWKVEVPFWWSELRLVNWFFYIYYRASCFFIKKEDDDELPF